ncbi:hypothetical protein ABT224_29655 [Streptomyces sp. NPDC001584]|uniref:hypothetical protein n=1 Tax=Streptomyces sp. NPDC001584 TaxID=3154521 RepID=UPI00332E0944
MFKTTVIASRGCAHEEQAEEQAAAAGPKPTLDGLPTGFAAGAGTGRRRRPAV